MRRGSRAICWAAPLVIEATGFFLFLLGPLLAILLVRTRGRVRPLTAYVAAIAGAAFGLGALALGTYVQIRWERAHASGAQYFAMIGDPSISRHLVAIGGLVLFACVVASLFLLVQWSLDRLRSTRR